MKQLVTKEQVLAALEQVQDPELHRSLIELNMVRKIEIEGNKVDVMLAITVPNCPFKQKIETDVIHAVQTLQGVEEVAVHMEAMTDDERKALAGPAQEGSATKYNRIQRVIAVMSGKGGVGKSLVTGLLGTGLVREGYRVGILDADITGPSIPMLFGLRGPVEGGPVGVRPLQSRGGISVISMNFLLDRDDQPIVWRGPIIAKAITQLWGDVMWGELDYLLVDLPPGTSDAALTTLQSLPVKGIVMVTTPQGLATMIVRKAVHMARSIGTPILGVVENMAYFVCPDTGKKHAIFGESHADEVAELALAPLLAKLPIDPSLAALCDSGQLEKADLPEIRKLAEMFLERNPVEKSK